MNDKLVDRCQRAVGYDWGSEFQKHKDRQVAIRVLEAAHVPELIEALQNALAAGLPEITAAACRTAIAKALGDE